MHIHRTLLAASWQSWASHDNRHRAGPGWLQWLWTLLLCMGLAAPFTVLGFSAFARGDGAWRNAAGWACWYGKNGIVCLTISVVIHLLFDITRHWFATPARVARLKNWQRRVFFLGLPLLGMAMGWPLGVLLTGADVTVWFSGREGNNVIVGTVLIVVLTMCS